MSDSLGARLRRHREQQNVALAAIAEQTKIKQSLLEGLERDDVSRWPSGIFRRAYVRAYAHAIGLSPDEVVREFLELYPDAAEDVAPISAISAAVDARTGAGGPPTRLRFLVGSAIASLARLRRGPEGEPQIAADHLPSGHAAAEQEHGGVQPAFAIEPQMYADERVEVTEPEDVSPPGARHATPAPAVNQVYEWFREDNVTEPPRDSGIFTPAHRDEIGEPPNQPRLGEVSRSSPQETVGSTSDNEVVEDSLAAEPTSSLAPPAPPDLSALASLCTELGRADDAGRLLGLLEDGARLLDAPGLSVWIWDGSAAGLRPVLVCGYSDEVVAQLPLVAPDADNATATAFRTAKTCVITGSEHGYGALVTPLLTPAGCIGVLALELDHGGERREPVRAAAIILAALLAQLIGVAPDEPG